MDIDTYFVVGVIISILAIPAIVSAFSDNRTPRVPALVILIGALMIGYAMNQRPGAYGFDTLPDVFVNVVSRLMN